MSVFAWLETQGTASREKRKNWLRRVTDRRRTRRHRGGAHSFQRRRALFESLEQRNLLTVAIWDGVGFELDQDGNIVREADGISWHDRLNWQGDVLPSPGDSIIIPDVPNTTTVRLNQGDWDVADIVSDVRFELLSGATLSVADTVQVNHGTFLIGGGTLDQATIVTGTGESAVRSTSGVLRNVTIAADILFENNQTVIEDNLTLHSTATIHGQRSNNPIFGRIAFAESVEGQTLDGTGTIEFTFSGITGQFHPGQIIVEGETTLTVGPDITIRGQRGLVGPSGGVAGSNTIVNQGTISADATGEITILPETFVNEGLVESHQFGHLRIASPAWTSTGTIRAADNRAVVLDGTFTLPSGHDFELENGGRIQQAGILENEGNTVTIDTTDGSYQVEGGQIHGGTITGPTDSQLRFNFSTANLLRGVTLNVGMDLVSVNRARVRIEEGLTLNGTATVHGRRSNLEGDSRLIFSESAEGQTLDGTGTIEFTFSGITGQFHPGQIIVEGETTLTVGPDITIRGQRGLVGPSGGVAGSNTIVNRGTISADATGEITILPETFVNEGLVESHQFGHLRIASPVWTSTGTIRAADNRAVVLEGTFTLPSGHDFELENGGRIQQAGILENEGNTVTIDTTDGSYQVEGGQIHGGTITGPTDSQLRFNFSTANLLRGVTLNVGMDLVSVNRARVRIEEGLTLNGTATVHGRRSNLEGDSRLIFSESAEGQTLDGTGTIEFTYASSTTGGHHPGQIIVEGETTLTVGPDITIRGQRGLVGPSGGVAGSNTIVNRGRILADVTGGLSIVASMFSNQGVLEAIDQQLLVTSEVLNVHEGHLEGGTWAATGNGDLRLNSISGITSNSASILLRGTNARISQSAQVNLLSFLQLNAATGMIHVDEGHTLVTEEFTNSGTVQVGNAGNFDVQGTFQQTGGEATIHGILTASDGIDIQGGLLTGEGILSADVSNEGTLAPGNPTGSLTITGDYMQGQSGELQIDFDQQGHHGQLNIQGSALLDGTLRVLPSPSFLPELNESFPVMTFAYRSNDFAVYEGLGLANQLRMEPEFDEDRLLLNVVEDDSAISYVVTTTANDGPGSLRQVLQDANLAEEAVTISFAIPESDPGFVTNTLTTAEDLETTYSVFVIQPESALPAMENANFGITIDGRSQFDHTGDTNPFGPVIVLDGSLLDATVSDQDGLKLQSNNNQIVGLNIRSFPEVGVRITGNNNWLAGNYIGTDATGTVALGNGDDGIQIMPGSAGNVIGGTAPSERNVISGNAGDGVELWGIGTSENVVLGNYIGTDATGLATLGNGQSGVRVSADASDNLIGGTEDGAGNVISGNSLHGVYIIRAGSDNQVRGNLIGTDATGTAALGNTGSGVGIDFSPNSIIGGNVPGARNVISGNLGNGIQIWGEDSIGNWIAGNYIGTDITGSEALGNVSAGVWVTLEASDNVIGTNGDGIDDEAERNVISGNLAHGIAISGAGTDHNVVAGNYIGTDASGAAAIGNGTELFQAGVHITDGARFNLIGTDGDGVADEAERNVISGNAGHGINLWDEGTDENVIAGNFIGTNAEGKTALGNGSSGIQLFVGPKYNRIGTDGNGTADAAQRNVISGNTTAGILLNGGGVEFNVVAGNYIGTDVTGMVALGNGSHGVTLSSGASHNLIGTNGNGVGDEAERNVISGNTLAGVQISNSHDNLVAGNYIGVDVTGTEVLGNGTEGVVVVSGATGNVIGTIGGVANPEAQRNVISGNERWAGVFIVASHDNVVAGNYIGTDASGTEALGVSGHGIEVKTGSTGNRIGTNGDGVGDEAERNVISGNAAAGIFIWEQGTDHNVVAGNYIGIDATGTAALGNGSQGVILSAGASNNLIGTDGDGVADEAGRNVISGNTTSGVFITGVGTDHNVVAGNYIGTDVNGTAAIGNGTELFHAAVHIAGGARFNLIGTDGDGVADEAERNVISGNIGHGVRLRDEGTDENVIAGNYIGVDVLGTAALANGWIGVTLAEGAKYNRIGTDGDGVNDEAERNVISGNFHNGVTISGAGTDHNVVAGNYIGTDVTGTAAIGNGTQSFHAGVRIAGGARFNLIGTDGDGVADEAERNLISGNTRGVQIDGIGSNENIVAGNFIGTDATGSDAIANLQGVWIASPGNVVGGSETAQRNLISGNTFNGIVLFGSSATENLVMGNFIGTDRKGTAPLGNMHDGVHLLNAVNNDVRDNLISGNSRNGVWLFQEETEGNRIQGNMIGTNNSGTSALPNAQHGVAISDGANSNLIGTDGDGVTDEAERNVISGNSRGVQIDGIGSDENIVAGNYIGTDATGTEDLGNGSHGVEIIDARDNQIGGEEGLGNTIAFNGGDGVRVTGSSAVGNTIRYNSIHSHTGLGIDLGGDGVTLNDPLDEDTGPNNLQNFPEIATAIPGGQTLVSGLLHSTPLSSFTLDFYANDEPRSSLHGQGQRWLGSAVVTTDAEGNAPFSLPLNATTSQGEWITATATAADGSTSEFSQATVAEFPTAEIVGILPIAPNPRNAPVERVDLAFSHAIDPDSFAPGAVSLTRNGQAVTVPSSVTFTTIGESTYRLAGLELATETDGHYELIVDASQLIDSFGNPAEGTATASWLMDTVKPTSKVNPLPRRAESLMFPVSVTGSDPAPAGVTPSGVVSYDLFVRVDGGTFEFWTTVPADEPVALFTAESSHRYGFRSVARDAAGNVETKDVKVEASIFVPDLDPPQTTITSIDSTSPTFVIEFSGTDTGGSGLAFFELYVAIDGGQPEQIATVNAGTADANGVHHGSATFQALADGEEHTYEFFTIGVDTAGNFEEPDETVSVTATFDTPEALEVVSFVVQHGMIQRSYIRFLEVTFNQKDPLPAMFDSLADGNGETDRIRLRHVDYEGNLVGMVLDVSMISTSGHTILIDFGAEGIGGNRNSTAGDGFYELAFDLTDDGQFDAAHTFHRLLGDITGDRQVTSDDLDRVFAAWGSSGPNLEEDVNGSGAVTTEDVFVVWNHLGRKLEEDWLDFFDSP